MNPTRDNALQSWLASEQVDRLLEPVAEERRPRALQVFGEIFVAGWDMAVARVIRRTLAIIGEEGVCDSCRAKIWFITNPKTGKKAPYSANGVNHFVDCPHADQHRKANSPQTPEM